MDDKVEKLQLGTYCDSTTEVTAACDEAMGYTCFLIISTFSFMLVIVVRNESLPTHLYAEVLLNDEEL